MHKYIETPLHGLLSLLTITRKGAEVILLCNGANSPFAWLARLKRIPILINVDGIERQRTKWNFFGKLWYQLGERCSVLFATKVISDADVIADYYKEQYGKETTVVPYGAEAIRKDPGETLKKFALQKDNYILYVSRLEPENNALGVIQAYKKSGVDVPLVIVGDAPYAEEYKRQLREEANERVIFTGFQFGEAYQEFQSNCMMYIQATEVGGTHPALIEAMAYGNCVLANGTPENIEVLGDAGEIYKKNDFSMLSELIRKLASDKKLRNSFGERAKARANKLYSWNVVTDQYEALFYSLTN